MIALSVVPRPIRQMRPEAGPYEEVIALMHLLGMRRPPVKIEAFDISDVAEIKHQALLCHKSQDGEAVWQDHEIMHSFRGRECGVERAEAYIRIDRRDTAQRNLPCLV